MGARGVERILVMGATGLVGRELLAILHERQFPHTEIVAVASAASAGLPLTGDGFRLTVVGSDPGVFRAGDLVFFTGHDDLAAELVPRALAAGATVIDNSATYRMHPAVPLVIPEINAAALASHQGLIANPNCTTAVFLVPLATLWEQLGLEWVSVASYQAISGAGTGPYNAFREQLALAAGEDFTGLDAAQLPCNVLPLVGSLDAAGMTSEETKMVRETAKILGDGSFAIVPTAVRVPTLVGHFCAVHGRTREELPPVPTLRSWWQAAPGVAVLDDLETKRFPTAVGCAGKDAIEVGRIRRLDSHTFAFVCAGDNLRKGAALNAVQIAEELMRRDLMTPAKWLSLEPAAV